MPHPVDNRDPPQFRVGVEDLEEFEQPLGIHFRANLDANRIADAAEVIGMGTLDLRRPHADPRKVCAEVVPSFTPWHLASHRLLVRQEERFVACEEVDPADFRGPNPGQGLHESERVGDTLHHLLVFPCTRRVCNKLEVPVFGVVEVGKPTVDKRADKIQGQRSVFVATQHPLRIRDTVSGGEIRAVDDLATVSRQGHAITLFGVRAAWFGVLAGKSTDSGDAAFEPEGQQQAHLKEDLELVGDDLRRTLVESFGAGAPLEKESFSFCGLRKLNPQPFDLP